MWRTCKLGDVVTLKRGHDLPEAVRHDGEIPVVSSSGITGYHNEAKAKGPGVVTGRYGTLGEVFYVEQDYWPLNTALYVIDFKSNHPRFVAYLLQNVLRNYQSEKAAVPGVNRNVLHELNVRSTDRTTQEAIVDTLSAYDSLIENNLRRMKLLEESARLLYREWFVRLRFPGHEHTRIINGVPEGWERKKMRDICESIGGGTPSTSKAEFWEGDITWITPTDITRNNCLALLDSEKKITESGLKNSSAKLLPPETILMTSRATLGFFGLIDREVCTNQGFISIVPHEDHLRMYLLHNLISRREEIIGKAGGTTYKEVNKSTFREMEIILPPKSLLEQFHGFAYDTLKQTRILKKQMEKLKTARDLLLPKLMSGEIAV
jgi:type I restriction enzyme S subunit